MQGTKGKIKPVGQPKDVNTITIMVDGVVPKEVNLNDFVEYKRPDHVTIEKFSNICNELVEQKMARWFEERFTSIFVHNGTILPQKYRKYLKRIVK